MTHTGAASDLCARCGHERRYHGPHDLRRSHHVFGEKGNGGKPHPRAQVIGTNPWYCGENPMCTCLKFVEAEVVATAGEDLW